MNCSLCRGEFPRVSLFKIQRTPHGTFANRRSPAVCRSCAIATPLVGCSNCFLLVEPTQIHWRITTLGIQRTCRFCCGVAHQITAGMGPRDGLARPYDLPTPPMTPTQAARCRHCTRRAVNQHNPDGACHACIYDALATPQVRPDADDDGPVALDNEYEPCACGNPTNGYRRLNANNEGSSPVCITCSAGLTACAGCMFFGHVRPERQEVTPPPPHDLDEIRRGYCRECLPRYRRVCIACQRTGDRNSRDFYLATGDRRICITCVETPDRTFLCVGCRGYDIGTPRQIGRANFCETCALQYSECQGGCGTATRRGTHCPNCTPIRGYQERAPQLTGFLGTPTEHAKCPRTKLDRHGKPLHAPGCKFDGIYLGVELEVECTKEPEGQASDILKVLNRPTKQVIIKRDGSLRHGFEIVTGPATLAHHRQLWKQFMTIPTVKQLRSHNTETCGLHVHISRASLSWLQIGKMISFLHAPENYEFIRIVAGRGSNRYQDFLTPRQFGIKAAPHEGPLPPMRLLLQGRGHADRYTALNLGNADTVEMRIFRGTLNPRTLMARIEFAYALTKFAAPCESSTLDMLAPAFSAWIAKRQTDFPALAAHLATAGLIVPLGREEDKLKAQQIRFERKLAARRLVAIRTEVR